MSAPISINRTAAGCGAAAASVSCTPGRSSAAAARLAQVPAPMSPSRGNATLSHQQRKHLSLCNLAEISDRTEVRFVKHAVQHKSTTQTMSLRVPDTLVQPVHCSTASIATAAICARWAGFQCHKLRKHGRTGLGCLLPDVRKCTADAGTVPGQSGCRCLDGADGPAALRPFCRAAGGIALHRGQVRVCAAHCTVLIRWLFAGKDIIHPSYHYLQGRCR